MTEDWDVKDLVVDTCWPVDVCVVDALGLVSVIQVEGLLLRTEEDGVRGDWVVVL